MTDGGMLCPKCNNKTHVYESKPKPNGTTKRRRQCLCCGFRFCTVEITAAEFYKNKRK